MICNYTYKGVQYTEAEIRKLLGNEFFNNDMVEITEMESVGKSGIGLSIIRNAKIKSIFGSDIKSQLIAQERIANVIGDMIYIGSPDSVFFQSKQRNAELEGEEIYVPETLDVTIQQLHNELKDFLNEYEKDEQMQSDVYTTEMYRAISYLKDYNKFKSFIHELYPESLGIISEQEQELDVELEFDEEGRLQTIQTDIQQEEKKDREKSQSKYVKFFTSFVEYDVTIDADGSIEYSLIKDPGFVYFTLLSSLSNPVDTTNYISQIQEAFKLLIDINATPEQQKGESIKVKKQRAVYEKLLGLSTSLESLYDDIINHPILSKMRFDTDNSFIWNTTLKGDVFTKFNAQLNSRDNVRINRAKDNLESTPRFLFRIQQAIKEQTNEDISLKELSKLWMYHYNKTVLTDITSLMMSQRDANPIMSSTDGKFGEITLVSKPASKIKSAISVRSALFNNFANFFETKERISDFIGSKLWETIKSDLRDTKNPSKQKNGIRKFIEVAGSQSFNHNIELTSEMVNQTAQNIQYMVETHLKEVNISEKDIAEERSEQDQIESDLDVKNESKVKEGQRGLINSDDIIRNNSNSLLNVLADIVEADGVTNIVGSGKAADNTTFYPHHNGSTAEKIHDILNLISKTNTGYKGKLNAGKFNRNLPSHLNSRLLALNPIANGIVKMGKTVLHKGNLFYNRPKMYSREKINNWFMREFSEGFITEIKQSSVKNMKYNWFYPPISNKPNVKGVEVTVSSSNEIIESIMNIVSSIVTRPTELEGIIKNYKTDNFTLFNVIEGLYDKSSKQQQSLREDLIANNYNIKALKPQNYITLNEMSNTIFNEILKQSVESARDFVVANELYISKDMDTVSSRLKNFVSDRHMKTLNSIMQDNDLLAKDASVSFETNNFSYGAKVLNEETNRREKQYTLEVKDFIGLYSLFYLNNYINTFAIPQLVVGDGVFFKNENDFIKRLSIAFSPGTSLMVNKHGTRANARIMVLQEYTTAKGREGLRQFVTKLLDGASKEEIENAVKQFSDEGFDRADAQGFMLDSRLEDLQRGTGFSFAQGTAVKPVIHTHRQVKINRNDAELNKQISEIQNQIDILNQIENITDAARSEIKILENKRDDLIDKNTYTDYVPTSVKYASFALTKDSYLMKYPKVVALRQFMIDNQIDEVVFKSGVKVGSPENHSLFGLEDVINMVGSKSHRQFGPNNLPKLNLLKGTGDKNLSIMNIDNRDYRIQQNPNTNKKYDKKINNPTQITYVLNIASKSKPENAQKVYKSLNSIMRIQSKELYNALTENKVTSKYLTDSLNKKLKGELNELFAQFLEAGLDINFPAFLQKAVIQFSSYVSDEILSIPFEGGKFQIVSDVLFEVKDKDKTKRELEVKKDEKTGLVYAEVLAPKAFKNKLQVGDEFLIDGFSVRIPSSGFHSAIPLKIVGFVDYDSDVLIVPKEITPIQGSDFDADSLFLIRRATWYDFKNRSLKKMNRGAATQLKKMIDQKYGKVKDGKPDTRAYLGYKEGKLQSEKEFYLEMMEMIDQLENVTEEQKVKVIDQFMIAYHKQNIVDLTIETLSDGAIENVKEVISPIQMQLVNGPEDSLYEYIARERGVSISSLTQTLDLGRLENKYAYYKRNFDGNALTGIFANLFKAVSYMNKAGEDFQLPKLKKGLFGNVTVNEDGTETYDKITIDGVDYESFNEFTSLAGKPVPVRMMMDILINLAIDNVKEQGLPTINASATTASVYVMGISLGISLENMVGLMLSPSAMRISEIKTRDAANTVVREIKNLLGEDINIDNIQITEELLKKQLKISNKPLNKLTKVELNEQLALMIFYKKLEIPANELNDLSINLSVIQDMKVNYKDVEKSVNYFKNKVIPDQSFMQIAPTEKDLTLFSVHNHQIGSENLKYVSSSFNIKNLLKSAPHIGQAIISQRMMYDYLSEVMPIYSPEKPYREVLRSVGSMLTTGLSTEERQDTVRKEILHFFASSSSMLSDVYNYTERKKHKKYRNYLLSPIDSWGMSIAEKVIQAQNEEVIRLSKDPNYDTNFFLKSLEVDLNKAGGYPFITLNMGRSLKPFHFYRAQEDFKRLPKTLQDDLVKYVIMFYGSKFGTSNFVFAIPPNMYKSFSKEFKNTLEKFLRTDVLENSELEKIKDYLKLQIVINNYENIGSLPSEHLSFNPSQSVELNDGSFVYFDMSHDKTVKPEFFQQGENDSTEQREDQTEDDVSLIDLLNDSNIGQESEEDAAEKEVNDERLAGSSKFDFVSTHIYDKETGTKKYFIYKRVKDIPIQLMPPNLEGTTFYQLVTTVKKSKYYTVPNELYEDTELKMYSLNEKFNPRLPSENISDEIFRKEGDEITIEYFAARDYIEGQNVIIRSSLDNERLNAKLYRVSAIKDASVVLSGILIKKQSITYTKVSDILPEYSAYEIIDDQNPEIDNESTSQMMAQANNIGIFREENGRIPYKDSVITRLALIKDIEANRVPLFNLVNSYAKEGVEALITRPEDVYDGDVNTMQLEVFESMNKAKFEKRIVSKFSSTGKALYKILSRLIKDNVQINISKTAATNKKGNRVLGAFKVKDGRQFIEIYKHETNDSLEHTLLHELFHAALDNFTDEYAAYKKGQPHNLSPEERVAMVNLERLYDLYQKNRPANSNERFDYDLMYEGQSKSHKLKEFLNDAITDPRLMSILNNISLDEENVKKPNIIRWIEKILDEILILFGIRENTVASALFGNIVFLINHRNPAAALRDSNEIVFKQSEEQEIDLSLQDEAVEILDNIVNKYKTLQHDLNAHDEEISAYTFDGVTARGLTDVINYDFRRFKRDYDIVETLAEKLWQGRDKNVKLNMAQEGIDAEINYHDFVAEKRKRFMTDAARGQIIHYEFQLLMNPELETVLRPKQNQLILDHNFEGISFDWIAGIYKKYGERMQFTKATKNYAEVPIFNKELRIGTRIDHVIVYEDGTFGINDWKSGSSMAKRNSGIKMALGDQVIDLSSDSISAAKLQVMFGAFLFKLENPEARFKNLSVTWVNNSRYQASKDNTMMVDIPAYLGAITTWFQTNTDPEIKKWYDNNKNHKAFNPRTYVGYTNEFANKTLAKDFSPEMAERALDNEILSLVMRSNPRKPDTFGEKRRERLGQLTMQRLGMEEGGDIFTARDNEPRADDISPIARYFASYEDIDNPYLNTFKKILDQKLHKTRREQRTELLKFESLLKPVYEDWIKKTGKTFRKELFKNRLTKVEPFKADGTGLYNFAWTVEIENGLEVPTLIHPTRHKEEWERRNLTENQKNLLIHFHEKIHKYFNPNDPNALMNRVVTTTESGKELTNYDILKRRFNSSTTIPYREGMTPRYFMPMKEAIDRFGWTNPKTWQMLYDKYLTFRVEQSWEEWANVEEIIPVKGIPTTNNVQSEMFTYNMEVIFDRFIRNMTMKDNLDTTFAVGQGIITYLKMKQSKNAGSSYKNTIGFLEDKLLLDILNETKVQDFSRKNINLPTFMIGKDDKQDAVRNIQGFSIHKLISTLRSITAASVMWLQPINGTRNAVFISLINSKDAIRNDILEKGFVGIDKNEVDFTTVDLIFAHKEVMSMYKDSMFGNVRRNKAYIMGKKLDYLPDNFDWASSENELLSSSNNLIDQGTMYMFHTIPEEAIALILMIAQLNHMKNPNNGKSIWESYGQPYDIGNGVYDVAWEGGVRGIVKDGARERELTELDGLEARRLKRVYQRMHGNYRREERVAAEAYLLGQIFMQFRKYLPAILFAAYGSKRTDQTLGYYKFNGDKKDGKQVMEWTGRLIEGRFRTLGYFIMDNLGLAGANAGQYKWDNLSTDQKAQLIDFMVTSMFFATLMSAIYLVFGPDDDKDSIKQWMTIIAQNMSQHWNILDQIRSGKMIPATVEKTYNLTSSSMTMFWSLMLLSTGDSESALTQKGHLKGYTQFRKSVPLMNSIYNAQRFIENTDVFGEDAGKGFDFYRTR